MGCLGVHFALSDDDTALLLSKTDDASRIELITEDIEERYLEEPKTYAAESDKAWDAMHRALANEVLSYDEGEYPLNHAVIGGEPLYGEDDYIMSLKTPAQVKDVAAALADMTEEQFRKRYDAIDTDAYGFDLTDEDFGYTWSWFQEVRLFATAASEKSLSDFLCCRGHEIIPKGIFRDRSNDDQKTKKTEGA